MKKKIFVTIFAVSLMALSMLSTVTSQSNDLLIDIKDFHEPPEKPTITGPDHPCCGVMCEYTFRSVDPQGDQLYYEIHCSDSPVIFETDYCCSGETMVFQHCWDDFYQKSCTGKIRGRAIDSYGHESEWATFNVEVQPKVKSAEPLFYRFLQNNPLIYQILTNLMALIK